MPLVDISILSGKSPEYIKAVGDCVNAAVIETMGFPADDRYQVIHQIDSAQLQFQQRTGDRVMMHLVMRAGRSDAQKQAFYKKVVENLAANPGIPPENILITITENHEVDWSFRDGVAQFVVSSDGHGVKQSQATETAAQPAVGSASNATAGTLVAQPPGPLAGLLFQDYAIFGVALALVGVVIWSIWYSAKR